MLDALQIISTVHPYESFSPSGAGTMTTTASVSVLGCLLGSSCSVLSAADEVCKQVHSSTASRSALSAALRRWCHPRANSLSRSKFGGGENYGDSSANDSLLHATGPAARQHHGGDSSTAGDDC
jgi:hypothetical protein